MTTNIKTTASERHHKAAAHHAAAAHHHLEAAHHLEMGKHEPAKNTPSPGTCTVGSLIPHADNPDRKPNRLALLLLPCLP